MLNESASKDDRLISAIFERLAVDAGSALLAVSSQGYAIGRKADDSPVTEADLRAEAIIRTGLAEKLAGIPVVAEESVAAGDVPSTLGDCFILVDAMDGTREFIAGRPDFTVNIALVREGNPVVGVVLAPAHRRMYCGRPGLAEEITLDDTGMPGARRRIAVTEAQTPPRILASRSHPTPETNAFLAGFPGAKIMHIGSSLKFCLIAAGEADIYPRFGATMEWDTAAGDAVLRAAGGMTATTDGAPLTYGKRGTAHFANPWFIARALEVTTSVRP